MENSPRFGQADLTNCERELIHLPGSIQPHGVLLVLREPDLRPVQVSANAAEALGCSLAQLLDGPLRQLGGDIAAQVHALGQQPALVETQPFVCSTQTPGPHSPVRHWHGLLHRVAAQAVLVLELEPLEARSEAHTGQAMLDQLSAAVQRFSQAASAGVLCDALARSVRELIGHDRVMVYKFDPEGHGKIVAEAREPRLDSLLGHHYPSTDIPQRARELYLRNRVRLLVDVHYQPVPLVPPGLPGAAFGTLPVDDAAQTSELDMSMCGLRSMSPLHLQYLKNMGVTATLVVSLVREGRLWGLIAAHHYSPRPVTPALRAACDLLAEAAATRIAAIENYAYAQVAILVRRLEQRLVEATSVEGDWRLALFRNPRTLLQPLEATGAALFHDGELLTSGEVPSTPELRALARWVDTQYSGPPFACSSVGKANPELDSLTPMASGVLAFKLSTSRPDYLMWFRKEQLLTVTWAGDPVKVVVGNDPLQLSPRRSFAAWSEIVRGTALPWSGAELALARAVGAALVDIIVQVNAVRLLVAEHQLAGVRATVHNSQEPVAIADRDGRLLFANPALVDLLQVPADRLQQLADLNNCFTQPELVRQGLDQVGQSQQPWRTELALQRAAGPVVPVALRAELVPGRDRQVLGMILVLTDISAAKRADAARLHLEQALVQTGRGLSGRDGQLGHGADPDVDPDGDAAEVGARADAVISAILTNSSLAAMDIADSASGPGSAPLLEEVEASTRRAALLYSRIRNLAGRP